MLWEGDKESRSAEERLTEQAPGVASQVCCCLGESCASRKNRQCKATQPERTLYSRKGEEVSMGGHGTKVKAEGQQMMSEKSRNFKGQV